MRFEEPVLYKVKSQSCSNCGHVSHTVSDVLYGDPPGAGNYNICMNCGEVTVFNNDRTRRPATEEELADFNGHALVQAIKSRGKFFHRKES